MKRLTFITLIAISSTAMGCSKEKDTEPADKQPTTAPATQPKTPETKPAAKAVDPIPEGFSTVTPVLIVHDVDAAIAYYEKHLGATKRMAMPGPDGKTGHAELMIGDSIIMLGGEMAEMGAKSPRTLGGTNGSLLVYVDDVDAVVAALTADGATVAMPLMDAFWGDRYGSVTDPFGHNWGVATHKEDLTPEQMAERAAAMNDPKALAAVMAKNPGTPAKGKLPEGYHTVTPGLVLTEGMKALEFYKNALGAEVRMSTPMPDGSLMHAEITIGDSVVMMGDEMPAMMPTHKAPKNLGGAPLSLMLYVEDADKAFAQAISAGATEKEKMQDAFWGDRFGMVTDPNGHQWGLSTHKEDLTPEQIAERMKAAYGAHAPPANAPAQ